MTRRTTLTIAMALGLALGGVGTARAASATSGEAISTIREIDPGERVVVLADGMHLLATDPAVLAALHEGEIVRVQYTQDAGHYFIDRIEQVSMQPGNDNTFDASPPSTTTGAYDSTQEPQAP